MITALIIAGGRGIRMAADIPKQFIEVDGKPILAYTIEKFERHPAIDSIYIVCIAGWEDYVRDFVGTLGFRKVQGIVTGGDSALSSIKKGMDALPCSSDDIVVVHDGVRPLVDAASIDAVIADCSICGGAISSFPLTEHIVYADGHQTDLKYIPRENAFRTITPQAYKYGKVIRAYQKAEETGIGKNSAFIGTMMMDLGEPVCLSKGSEKNIKITDPRDLIYFKSEL